MDEHPAADLPTFPGHELVEQSAVIPPGVVLCQWCDEPIDTKVYVLWPEIPYGLHRECAMRQVAGSVGHQTCRCTCYGGDYGDPPGMTRREAAIAATRLWEATHDRFN